MKQILMILIFYFCINLNTNCQLKTINSLQNLIDYKISEFKSIYKNYDHIFIISRLDTCLHLPSHVYNVINDGINPKFLNKKDKNYIIYLTIDTQSDCLKVYVLFASIIKQSNRKIAIKLSENGETFLVKGT